MRKIMRKVLLFLPLLAAIVQGCEKDNDRDMYEIAISRIVGDVSDVATVTVYFQFANYSGYPFDASGMTFKLPQKVSVNLSPVEDLFPGAADDQQAMYGRLDFFGYAGDIESDKAIGQFVRDISGDDYRTIVEYVYVDRPLTVRGTGGDKSFGYDVDLTLNAGWNRISVKIDRKSVV